MHIGVVSNPRSRRNRDGMDALRAVLARSADVAHVELDGVQQLPEALRDLARRDVELIVVNGGDGTVHSLLTALFNGGAFERLPALAVLPSGNANLIAADVGLPGGRPGALEALLARARTGDGLRRLGRPVLSVDAGLGRSPMYGMFLGTGAFHRTALLARRRIHPTGAHRSLAIALALGVFAGNMLWRRGGPDALYQGQRISIALDEAPAREGSYLGLLATTLERLVLGLMPFWGDGAGGVRYTFLPFPPGRFARAALPVLRGRPRPWMSGLGYASGRANEVAFALDGAVVLDGEMFHAEPGVPVRVRADRRIDFVTLAR